MCSHSYGGERRGDTIRHKINKGKVSNSKDRCKKGWRKKDTVPDCLTGVCWVGTLPPPTAIPRAACRGSPPPMLPNALWKPKEFRYMCVRATQHNKQTWRWGNSYLVTFLRTWPRLEASEILLFPGEPGEPSPGEGNPVGVSPWSILTSIC